MIRPARGDEADQISALALRSKGYWGYSQEFLDACRDELTYTADVCGSGDVVVAESRGEVVGFFVLHGTGPVGELDALFVDPSAVGSGLGRRLLTTALEQARDRGYDAVQLAADPGAESFYVHHGARRTGEVPSGSIPGRTLPVMEFRLVARPEVGRT